MTAPQTSVIQPTSASGISRILKAELPFYTFEVISNRAREGAVNVRGNEISVSAAAAVLREKGYLLSRYRDQLLITGLDPKSYVPTYGSGTGRKVPSAPDQLPLRDVDDPSAWEVNIEDDSGGYSVVAQSTAKVLWSGKGRDLSMLLATAAHKIEQSRKTKRARR